MTSNWSSLKTISTLSPVPLLIILELDIKNSILRFVNSFVYRHLDRILGVHFSWAACYCQFAWAVPNLHPHVLENLPKRFAILIKFWCMQLVASISLSGWNFWCCWISSASSNTHSSISFPSWIAIELCWYFTILFSSFRVSRVLSKAKSANPLGL